MERPDAPTANTSFLPMQMCQNSQWSQSLAGCPARGKEGHCASVFSFELSVSWEWWQPATRVLQEVGSRIDRIHGWSIFSYRDTHARF